MLALLAGAVVVVLLLAAGLALAVYHLLRPPGHRAAGGTASPRSAQLAGGVPVTGQVRQQRAADVLAGRPMPTLAAEDARPAPVSTRDPGPPIRLPKATATGPAGVPTGFPHTREGAMAQLAAIDQAALAGGDLAQARAVITGWARPGGPTPASWSAVKALAGFLTAAGLSGGGSGQLALVVTPLMGQFKASIGAELVIPCIDFEFDATLTQTARVAAADCQRMVWTGARWMIGPGPEPADPPSAWPDTDAAVSVGYRDLRRG